MMTTNISKSIKDLRAYQAGRIEKVEDLDIVPQQRAVKTQIDKDDDFRHTMWKQLGPALRIQRFYRRYRARLFVKNGIEKRRHLQQEEYRDISAEIIQNAFRGYRARQKSKC